MNQLASEAEDEAFIIALDGFEGPLDVLLTLARGQKVDLRDVSIVQLADQYLNFVATARRLRLELAADYLVMAAWLAYLKSRLLLPPPHVDEDGVSADELAAHLAFQLERLQAMRQAAAKLFARPQLGIDRFGRGAAEGLSENVIIHWVADQGDLLRAYARLRTRDAFQPLHLERRAVLSIDEALERLQKLVGVAVDWTELSEFLPGEWRDPLLARSGVASTFLAMLELAKRGDVELRQQGAFAPIYLKRREQP